MADLFNNEVLEDLSKIGFESDEEMYAYIYFSELRQAGYVSSIVLHPEPYVLSSKLDSTYESKLKTKTIHVTEEILKPHIYTADLMVIWTEKAKGLFFETIDGGERFKKGPSMIKFVAHEDSSFYYSIVEVKPTFDMNNMTRLAKINQKWVWEKYQKVVNIMVPEKWFKNTFTPNRFLKTNKSGKARKIKFETKSLNQYLESLSN